VKKAQEEKDEKENGRDDAGREHGLAMNEE
jgi:hypothetical protein